jgi:hypothetical protein
MSLGMRKLRKKKNKLKKALQNIPRALFKCVNVLKNKEEVFPKRLKRQKPEQQCVPAIPAV